jgi:hypothetical protein
LLLLLLLLLLLYACYCSGLLSASAAPCLLPLLILSACLLLYC